MIPEYIKDLVKSRAEIKIQHKNVKDELKFALQNYVRDSLILLGFALFHPDYPNEVHDPNSNLIIDFRYVYYNHVHLIIAEKCFDERDKYASRGIKTIQWYYEKQSFDDFIKNHKNIFGSFI
jgi:hypothetical protein